MKTARSSSSPQTICRDNADNELQSRRFKHRLTAQGIQSICLLCNRLVGEAQDEWLLLSLELVHLCADERGL
ncbi:hypothetical protein [Granulicella sp. dw_53]|uniref:hypothetical protein n=1 Tax=Granulicella sp. dw_53 TaxID=2719792 RepID=UPI001BD5A85E|nr:hypothetical protein [Granulicella sp. dw_53]